MHPSSLLFLHSVKTWHCREHSALESAQKISSLVTFNPRKKIMCHVNKDQQRAKGFLKTTAEGNRRNPRQKSHNLSPHSNLVREATRKSVALMYVGREQDGKIKKSIALKSELRFQKASSHK